MEKRFKVGLPKGDMVFDERTKKRLREIARMRTISDDELHYVKDIARKRQELFYRTGGTDHRQLVEAVNREILGDAIERVMEAVEGKLRALEIGERLIQEDVAATMREARERGKNPMKEPAVMETRNAYNEHVERMQNVLNELSSIFSEAPLLYQVYVRRKGRAHPLMEQAFAWAEEEKNYGR